MEDKIITTLGELVTTPIPHAYVGYYMGANVELNSNMYLWV